MEKVLMPRKSLANSIAISQSAKQWLAKILQAPIHSKYTHIEVWVGNAYN